MPIAVESLEGEPRAAVEGVVAPDAVDVPAVGTRGADDCPPETTLLELTRRQVEAAQARPRDVAFFVQLLVAEVVLGLVVAAHDTVDHRVRVLVGGVLERDTIKPGPANGISE